jgi:hypothetical protein
MMVPVLIDGKQIGVVAKTDKILEGTYTMRGSDAFAGGLAMEGCFRRYHPEGMPAPERLLRVLRAIGEALNDGQRDSYMEQEVLEAYMKFSGGLTGVECLLRMPDILEPQGS